MKKAIGLLTLLILGFTSCDGRKTAKESLAESIVDFKTEIAIESHTYIPESYTEITKDTLLSNGFEVKIKTFTNMENNVLRSVVRDTITYKEHYREVEGLLSITFKNKLVFEKTINKDFILSIKDDFKTELDASVLQSIWVNQDQSLLKNTVTIDLEFCAITTDACQRYTINVDNEGLYKINSQKDYIY